MRRHILASRRVWLRLGGAIAVAFASLSPAQMQTPGQPAAPRPARDVTEDAKPIQVLVIARQPAPQRQERQQRPGQPSPTMFTSLTAPLARRGIQLTHVPVPEEALTPAKVKYYDALMVYGEQPALTPEQEKVLVDFVEGGKGLVAIHSASPTASTSDAYATLVGAGAQAAGGDADSASAVGGTLEIVQPSHPVLQDVKAFAAKGDALASAAQAPGDRTVLIERVATRTNNPYGRARKYQEDIRRYVAELEPLLRSGATVELDGRRSVRELADAINALS